MKVLSLLVFLFLIISITAKSEIEACNYESSVLYNPALNDCKDVSTDDNSQCCVALVSFYGDNQYFCETFNKGASQEEINSQMKTNFIDKYAKLYPGLAVKVSASCSEDIPPFKREKCTIEDTQSNKQFGNCTNFVKNKEDDYCCLFSGKINDNEVQFCTELNKDEVSNIDETTKKIDRSSEMYDIDYIACSPSYRPDSKQFYLSYNLLILGLLILISF